MSLTGLIDLHSHLLPGIDDGCRTLEESLDCVRTLLDHGFVGTTCTPHMGMSAFPENSPANIAGKVAALQEQLRQAGLNYPLWAGGELRLADDTFAWLSEHGIPTLGPGRHVLIDYWGRRWPAYADRVVEHLLEQGYHPILAHPERMDLEDQEWDTVLAGLQQRGVWLQGNLKCLAGREGPRVGLRALRLLRESSYSLLATDMHGTPDLVDRLAGLRVVEHEVGQAKLRELLVDGPRQVFQRPDSR
jgi:protein-tyrosine phosphatase